MLIGQDMMLLFDRNLNYLDCIPLIMMKQGRDMKSGMRRDRALIGEIFEKIESKAEARKLEQLKN